MRVYELAKEYDKKSVDFLDIIRDFGIDVKSHLSSLNDGQVTEIKNKIDTRQVAIDLENDLLERSIGVEEPLEDSERDLKIDQIVPVTTEDDVERPVEIDASFIENESETEEFNGVEVDEQLNPVDEMEDGEEETDTELSFGQKAFAKAKAEEEETEDVTEDWSSMKELARQDDDAEWTKKVLEADAKIAVQQVIVERPKGIWGWFKGLFS